MITIKAQQRSHFKHTQYRRISSDTENWSLTCPGAQHRGCPSCLLSLLPGGGCARPGRKTCRLSQTSPDFKNGEIILRLFEKSWLARGLRQWALSPSQSDTVIGLRRVFPRLQWKFFLSKRMLPLGSLKRWYYWEKNKKEKEKKLKLQWISISHEKTCFINQNLILQEPDEAAQSPVRAGGCCYRHAMRSQPLTTQVPAPFLMENPWPTSERSTWSNATYLPQTSFEEWTFWTLSNPQACIPPCPGGYIKCCWSNNKSRVQQTCAARRAWNHSR